MADEGRAPAASTSSMSGRRGAVSGWAAVTYGFPRQGGPRHPSPTYAALDLGTNNCRLLIARPTGDSFRVIDAFSRIIRLGEGVSVVRPHQRCGDLRAVEALAICRDKMRIARTRARG